MSKEGACLAVVREYNGPPRRRKGEPNRKLRLCEIGDSHRRRITRTTRSRLVGPGAWEDAHHGEGVARDDESLNLGLRKRTESNGVAQIVRCGGLIEQSMNLAVDRPTSNQVDISGRCLGL